MICNFNGQIETGIMRTILENGRYRVLPKPHLIFDWAARLEKVGEKIDQNRPINLGEEMFQPIDE